MPQYRIYFISPDGHIAAPPDIAECNDDQEAIQKAIQKAPQAVHCTNIELWQGKRLIVCLPRDNSKGRANR